MVQRGGAGAHAALIGTCYAAPMYTIAYFGSGHHCTCGRDLMNCVVVSADPEMVVRERIWAARGPAFSHTQTKEELDLDLDYTCIEGLHPSSGYCFCGATELPSMRIAAINMQLYDLKTIGDGFLFEVGDVLKKVRDVSPGTPAVREQMVVQAFMRAQELTYALGYIVNGCMRHGAAAKDP